MFSMNISSILGEFSIRQNTTILPEKRPKIDFSRRKTAENMDLLEGFDPNIELQTSHGIHHLYNFMNSANFFSRFIRNFDNFKETDFLFVCCRYVLTQIEKFTRGVPDHFEILAFRKDDIIYIGCDRSMITRKVLTEQSKLSIFSGLKFGKCLTTGDWSNLTDTHSIIRHIRIINHQTNSAHSVICSSTVRAFDNNSEPIEIHVKRDRKSFQHCIREWSFGARLSGSSKIIFGIRNENYKITKISETRSIRTDHSSALNMISEVLTMIAKLIENEKCVAVKPNFETQDMEFEKVDISYMNKSEQW